MQLLLNDTEITCKLDTGTEVTAISELTYKAIKKPQLTSPSKCLYSPSHQPLEVLSQFNRTFSHNGKFMIHPIFVVKNLKAVLLGLPAISSLKLVTRVDEIEQTDNIVTDKWKRCV